VLRPSCFKETNQRVTNCGFGHGTDSLEQLKERKMDTRLGTWDVRIFRGHDL
jgi:hypothetical protein